MAVAHNTFIKSLIALNKLDSPWADGEWWTRWSHSYGSVLHWPWYDERPCTMSHSSFYMRFSAREHSSPPLSLSPEMEAKALSRTLVFKSTFHHRVSGGLSTLHV